MTTSTLDIAYVPALTLAERIRKREISPVEVIDATFQRIQIINPQINAYCTLAEDTARREAKLAEAAIMKGRRADGATLGPLHGVPFSVKDLLTTEGVRTMRGSRLFEHFVPAEDAPAVDRLRKAGAILLGKTTTPEFGFKGVTDSPVTGVSRNPWNPSRTPGGSSGGAAAAVAAGLGPLALGTDGGGSIRAPASFSGIFGLKPSFGRVPNFPPAPVPALLHVGPMARSVRDAALMLKLIAGPDNRDLNSLPDGGIDFLSACEGSVKGLRIAWSPTLGDVSVDPEVAAITESAARVFAGDLGATIEELIPDFRIPPQLGRIFWVCGLGSYLEDRIPQHRDLLDPALAEMLDSRERLSGVEYTAALRQKHNVWDRARRLFERYDLLLTPTMPRSAPEIGWDPFRDASDRQGFSAFTFPFNLTGQPAASVPCGFTRTGLPVGLQIVGRRWDDAGVLRAAAAFEAIRPWQDQKPELR